MLATPFKFSLLNLLWKSTITLTFEKLYTVKLRRTSNLLTQGRTSPSAVAWSSAFRHPRNPQDVHPKDIESISPISTAVSSTGIFG